MQKIDIDSTVVTLDGEQSSGGGLQMRGKERVVFKPPEKSRLGTSFFATWFYFIRSIICFRTISYLLIVLMYALSVWK